MSMHISNSEQLKISPKPKKRSFGIFTRVKTLQRLAKEDTVNSNCVFTCPVGNQGMKTLFSCQSNRIQSKNVVKDFKNITITKNKINYLAR